MNGGSCGTCRFSKRQAMPDGSLGLQCRMEPPKVLVVPQMTPQGPAMTIQSAWPGVPEDGWCGKFEFDPMLARN
jgi:hypothetical protein